MKSKVLSRITPAKFPQMFPQKPILQVFLIELGIERAKHVSKLTGAIVHDNQIETNMEKNMRELESARIDLPALINYRDSYPEGHPKRAEVDHEIYETRRELTELEEKVGQEKPMKFVKDVVKFSSNEEHVETFDALADEIGAWFSTGVLGKGTVEYNGKTYTAE